MNRKAIVILFVMVFTTIGLMAQISYGLKGGLNMGTFQTEQEYNNEFVKMHNSYHITWYVDFPISKKLSIQPGVSLQGKGFEFDRIVDDSRNIENWHIMSIEVPINVIYYIPFGPGKLFLGSGLYSGFNFSGKYKIISKEEFNYQSSWKNLKFYGANKDTNPIDVGLNFLAGYKINYGIVFNAGYGLGLTNLNANTEKDGYSNRVLSFGLGLQF